MNITEAIAAEHTTFMSMFHQIELVLPGVKSQAEISTIAGVVAGLLGGHAQLETDLAFVALDRALLHKNQLKTIHREHHEMDERLQQVQRAATCGQARRLLRAALRASARHFRNEERYVLPMLERALKPEDLAALGKAFTRIRGGQSQAARGAGAGRLSAAQERGRDELDRHASLSRQRRDVQESPESQSQRA